MCREHAWMPRLTLSGLWLQISGAKRKGGSKAGGLILRAAPRLLRLGPGYREFV